MGLRMRPKYVSGGMTCGCVSQDRVAIYSVCSVLRPSVRSFLVVPSVPNRFSPILLLEGPFQDCPRRGWTRWSRVACRDVLALRTVSCVHYRAGEIVCEPARGFTYGVTDARSCVRRTKYWPRNYILSHESCHLFRIRASARLDLSGGTTIRTPRTTVPQRQLCALRVELVRSYACATLFPSDEAVKGSRVDLCKAEF